jgi:NAD(P)-dependent dehydrogenase (short-subunit alcohol dehydrogenase family)
MAKDLEGKVVLMTGATEGIGKAAALELARRGALLTITARSPEKGARVAEELRAAGAGEVELLLGDLSTLADTKRIAEEFAAKHDRLDVLVNNAGAMFLEHGLTKDGYERTFALNHLSYFGLTTRLMDRLAKTKGARVVSTSSMAHQMGKLDLPYALERGDKKAGWGAYADSKLANVLFTSELAKQLGAGVATSCYHPGYVRSGFGLNNGGFAETIMRFAGAVFARTPERGARTMVWLATSPEAASASGGYYADEKLAKVAPRGRDAALAAELWKVSEGIVAKA